MGHPQPAADAVPAQLDRIWESTHLRAHAFNFGFAAPNAVKDTLAPHLNPVLRWRIAEVLPPA